MSSVVAPPVIDRFDEVLRSLPRDVRTIVEKVDPATLSEIRMVYGYPLVLREDSVMQKKDLTISMEHIEDTRDAIDRFEDDWRSGLEGTLHRYSGIPNRYETCVGIAIRLARAYEGAAAALRGPFDSTNLESIPTANSTESDAINLFEILADPAMSMMLVGAPGSRKSTVLRDIGRISSIDRPAGYSMGQLCVIVDSSNELGGLGDLPHPAIGDALRIQVGRPEYQAKRIELAIRNLTAQRLIVDEIGYNNDVEQIQACSNLGVGVFCTLHGYCLADAVNNKLYWPLFGRSNGSERFGPVAFRTCLELRGPNRWVLYTNMSKAVDAILNKVEPVGIKIGSGW